jgi:uncharacterized protein (TIGR02466 family)
MLLKHKNNNDIYRMIFVENTDNNKTAVDSTPTPVASPEPVATPNVVNEVPTNSIKIQNVFITPVVQMANKYNFSKEELDAINKLELKANLGNKRTVSSKILEDENLKKMKDYINAGIKTYVDTIICPANKDIQFYITESWCNVTDPNHFHHKHAHPNSILSGCLYIQAETNVDRITFFNERYNRIKIGVDNAKFSNYNSESWWIPVETGDLIIFDSSLTHMVENTKSAQPRISLSFNVFVKGTLGEPGSLTDLVL